MMPQHVDIGGRRGCVELCWRRSAHLHLPAVALTASHLVADRACAPAVEVFAREGPGLDISPHIEPLARVLAAIRLWPELPVTSTTTAQCAGLAVICLERGVWGPHPQLLTQAAQALSRPEMDAQMCALSQAQHPQQHVFDSFLRLSFQISHAGVSWCPCNVAMPHDDCQQHRTRAGHDLAADREVPFFAAPMRGRCPGCSACSRRARSSPARPRKALLMRPECTIRSLVWRTATWLPRWGRTWCRPRVGSWPRSPRCAACPRPRSPSMPVRDRLSAMLASASNVW